MCFRVGSATVSRRRRSQGRLSAPAPQPPLAMLDLSNPFERQAHKFLCRATSKRDRMWKLLSLRRHGEVLLCVVRWVGHDNTGKPFSVAEVSLTAAAVCWREYATVEAVQAEMERRCVANPIIDGGKG